LAGFALSSGVAGSVAATAVATWGFRTWTWLRLRCLANLADRLQGRVLRRLLRVAATAPDGCKDKTPAIKSGAELSDSLLSRSNP